MTTNRQLEVRAKIRKAQRWLCERQIRFWMQSATSMEIATEGHHDRVRYFPLTGGVRIGSWYVPERGLHALEDILIERGILSEDTPLVAVDRRDIPEWGDPSCSQMERILKALGI